MKTFREVFYGAEKVDFDRAMAVAKKKVKPAKISKREQTKGGAKFNAVGIPVADHVVSVTDAGKGKLDWTLVGQQVVAGRRFVVPVVIEYVLPAEQDKWRAAMIDELAKELSK